MEINDLLENTGEWLKGKGEDADIVISSRARLARNLVQFPFISRATEPQKRRLEKLLRDTIITACADCNLSYFSLADASALDSRVLMERHLISRELAEAEGPRGVAISPDEAISVMVNEEDHLRMQVIHSGLELKNTWEETSAIDNALEAHLNYAFSSKLGYLTACPTNVGTGLRVSVMLHLPGMVITKQIEKAFEAVSKMNLAVRGLYGEGTQAQGDFYQISNQITLGKSEEELLESVSAVVPALVRYERMARRTLLTENRPTLEDRVFRSLGVLQNARIISSQEALLHLSSLRLGISLGLVSQLESAVVNELFILAQPAHLQKLEERELEEDERDIARASFIRKRLGKD